jgi:hypothetical protein
MKLEREQPKSFQPYAWKFGFWVRKIKINLPDFPDSDDLPSKLLSSLLKVFCPAWVLCLAKLAL